MEAKEAGASGRNLFFARVNRSEQFTGETLRLEFRDVRSAYDQPWQHTKLRSDNNVTADHIMLVIKDLTPEIAKGELRIDRVRNLPMSDVIEWGERQGYIPADLHELIAVCRYRNAPELIGPFALVAPGSWNRDKRDIDGYPSAFVDGHSFSLGHYNIKAGLDVQRRIRVLFTQKTEAPKRFDPEEVPAGEGQHEIAFHVKSTEFPTREALESRYHEMRFHLGERKSSFHPSLKGVERRTGKMTACLKSFHRWTYSKDVLSWASRHGYRAAFPWERESLLTSFPNLMRGTWLVDLGSVEIEGRFRFSPVVIEEKQGCVLWPHLSLHWHPGTRFLFIKKD